MNRRLGRNSRANRFGLALALAVIVATSLATSALAEVPPAGYDGVGDCTTSKCVPAVKIEIGRQGLNDYGERTISRLTATVSGVKKGVTYLLTWAYLDAEGGTSIFGTGLIMEDLSTACEPYTVGIEATIIRETSESFREADVLDRAELPLASCADLEAANATASPTPEVTISPTPEITPIPTPGITPLPTVTPTPDSGNDGVPPLLIVFALVVMILVSTAASVTYYRRGKE